MGKVLLASHEYLLPEVARAGLTAFTPNTITDRRRLTEELDKVREQGFAHTVSELMRDEASIAAPIEDRRGATVGAMSISGPAARLCTTRRRPRTELVGYVREAARSVSRELGAIPW
jgi:DNA-binding IclR family transcriptional regulator